jgi:glycerophosphoryl diester phosphodiesterase
MVEMKNSFWFQALKQGWHGFRAMWMPMAGYLLVVSLVSWGLLSPFGSWLLSLLTVGPGDPMIGNAELIDWLLSRPGLIFLSFGGSLVLMSLAVQLVGLIWIARQKEQGGIQSLKEALLQLFYAFPRLFQFCVSVCLLCVAVLAPLVLGLGAVYFFFLSAHDINFYVTAKPPAWTWALSLAGLWTVMWACAAGGFLVRWIYLLPLWLDGVRPFRKAMGNSWNMTKDVFWRLSGLTALCILFWTLAQVVAAQGLILVTRPGISLFSENLWGLFVVVCIYLGLTTIFSLVIHFVGAGWIVCTLMACYRDHSAPILDHPPPEKIPATAVKKHSGTSHQKLLRLFLLGNLLTVMAISIGFSGWMIQERNLPSQAILIIAHRAGAHHAPENSLSALKTAMEQKADYAEIDVQRTLDGTVVVVHDQDLMRLSRDPRRIGETSYQDLSQVDMGSRFGKAFVGERLARLSDFLRAASGKIKLLIELKYYGEDPLLAEETVKLVVNAHAEESVEFMSLNLEGVRQIKRLAPKIPAGYLLAAGLGDMAPSGVQFIAVPTGQATMERIKAARKKELKVYAWTVNDVDGILDLMEVGIDGVITDDPAMARKAVDDIRKLSGLERLLFKFRHVWD